MKSITLLVAIAVMGFSPSGSEVVPKEDKAAYQLLNQIRRHPKAFGAYFPFLKGIQPMPELKWNDTLARVAEAKALDMAQRNYFAHVDPEGYCINYYINKAGYSLDQIGCGSRSLIFLSRVMPVA